ncbi:MAG: hypothetical protein H6925_01620 [Holosporaceae bacterium]|nr:MAG: hypothetical protein H6925_01620 [Holosporaceae bacterium]
MTARIFYIFLVGLLIDHSAQSSFFNRSRSTVNINGQIQTLTKSTSCKTYYWNNRQDSSCMCCIAKKNLKGKRFTHDGKAVDHCLKKGHCTPEVLEEIGETVNRKYTPDDPSLLVSSIVNHVRTTETVSQFNATEHKNGKMTALGAGRAIRELAKRRLLGRSENISGCLKVEPLSAVSSQTLSLFLVKESSKCTQPNIPERIEKVYIIKQLKRGYTEAKRLLELRHSMLNQYALLNPERPKDFPCDCARCIVFSLQRAKRKNTLCFSLALSPGQSVFTTLKRFSEAFNAAKSDKTQDKVSLTAQENKVRSTMRILGEKIARLHKKYMTRKNGRLTGRSHATYGDFHSNNVFRSFNDIIIIDPESFVFSLKKPRPVGLDLTRIYAFSTLRNAKHQNVRKGNVGMTDWHKIVIDPFFRAYVKTFSIDENGQFNRNDFQDILRILRRNFSIRGATNDADSVFIKVGFIKSMWAYRKYIRRMLSNIETSLEKELSR